MIQDNGQNEKEDFHTLTISSKEDSRIKARGEPSSFAKIKEKIKNLSDSSNNSDQEAPVVV